MLLLLALVTSVAAGINVKKPQVNSPFPDSHRPSPDEPRPSRARSDPSTTSETKRVTDVRLPRHLTPEKYHLELVPFIVPGNLTIRGKVGIEMLCSLAASNVTLHAVDIEIENSTLTLENLDGNEIIQIASYDYDMAREFLILHLEQKLRVGSRYLLSLAFTSKLRDDLTGFFVSSYEDQKTGKKEQMAISQFEIAHARKAFPCFDEPGLKATYNVSLGRTNEMTSLSNMPVLRAGIPMQGSDQYVWDHFQESVKMSTYLVAFVISKFDFLQTTTDSGVTFRVWAQPNSLDQLTYASEGGPKLLTFFEQYFNIPFPLPKQDMIAVPDFGAGAMENWGLIVYKEEKLLYKDGVSSAHDAQKIGYIMGHELAHQWFGNLVSPSWWTDLWLNEGFASYFGYLASDAVFPTYNMMHFFLLDYLHDALRLDSLESSHPVSIPVKHPDEIGEIFDKISYGKGGSLARMMEHFLTTATYKKGLSNYLTGLSYQAANQDDLWRHLTDQSHNDGTLPKNMSVKLIMDTWTLQKGFPVVTFTRNYTTGDVEVTQEKFRSQRSATQLSPSWWVPLSWAAPGGDFNSTSPAAWLREGQHAIKLQGMPAREVALVANIQETGFYRVNYDQQNWVLLAKQLVDNHTAIHVMNRAQIVDDALNLAKSGYLDYLTALATTAYLSKEHEFLPWASALNGLKYLDSMLKRSPAYGEFQEYMLRLVGPLYTRLGFNPRPSDTHMDIKLREKAVGWSCKLGHPNCLAKAREGFAAWQLAGADGVNPVDVNLKAATYCHAIGEGGKAEWQFAWDRFTSSQVASESATLLSSTGCSKHVWILNRLLNETFADGSPVRTGDVSRAVGSVARNIIGRDLAFDYFRQNWSLLKERYGGNIFTFNSIVKAVMEDRNTDFEVGELEAFAVEHAGDLGVAARSVAQSIEAGAANRAWMEKNYDDIRGWLHQQNKAAQAA